MRSLFKASRQQKSMYASVILSSFIVGLFFNNCSNVRLAMKGFVGGLGSPGSKVEYLKSPEVLQSEIRVVFFVDMSKSMVLGACGGEVGESAQGNNASCSVLNTNLLKDSSDPDRNRLFLIKNWLDRYQASGMDLNKVKIMFVPFSGGFVETNAAIFNNNMTKFKPVPDALLDLDKLLTAQQEVFDAYTAGAANPTNFDPSGLKKMGTSVPSNQLRKMQTIVLAELDKMKNVDKNLNQAQFEFVLLSDGVPKPRKQQIIEATVDMWDMFGTDCSSRCKGVLGTILDGQPQYTAQCNEAGAPATEYGNCHPANASQLVNACFRNICDVGEPWYGDDGQQYVTITDVDMRQHFDTMRLAWGDFYGNTPAMIMKEVNTLRGMTMDYSEARFKFDFVHLTNKLTPQDLVPTANWMTVAKAQRAGRFNVLTSPDTPFDLPGIKAAAPSYRLAELFAVNTNARVDQNGNLCLDSDGDGLCDSFELGSGGAYNRSNPRTNGYCLDSLKVLGKCLDPVVSGCKEQLDSDGDGLNDCEEKALGTSPFDYDTDNDSIPDSLEVQYGLSGLKNDKFWDSNSDGTNNFDNFRSGLNPFAVFASIASALKTILRFEYVKDQIVVSGTGGPNTLVAGYRLQLLNVPLVATVSAQEGTALYTSPSMVPADKVDSPITTNHLIGENVILLLAKITDANNTGDVFWRMKKYIVPSAVKQIDIKLGDLVDINVNDPQGGF